VTLVAYHPLHAVYKFHAPAEEWKLRRYEQAITVNAAGEPLVGDFVEAGINLLRDPRAQEGGATQGGIGSLDTCTVYTLTQLRGVDSDDPDAPSYHDVLFDVGGYAGSPGGAYVVSKVLGWRDALGYETHLIRQGQMGNPPWV
jgi:hypothetical protein